MAEKNQSKLKQKVLPKWRGRRKNTHPDGPWWYEPPTWKLRAQRRIIPRELVFFSR